MRITGLSHQWGDRLFEAFTPNPNADERSQRRCRGIQQLLLHLMTIDGPDLWVGTSLSYLNFCARDTRHDQDRVPSLAWVETLPSSYRITYPVPQEFRPWPDADIVGYAENVHDAATMLLKAIAVSPNNPHRERSDWMWYICPACDFHSPHYTVNCERCGQAFPSEDKSQLCGIYWKVEAPAGAVVPTKSTNHANDAQEM